MSSIATKLETIVSTDAITVWEKIEPTLQWRISQAIIPGSPIECVVYPQTQAELAEVAAMAATNRWRSLLCGSGSKLGWGGLAAGIQLVISTARLQRLIEHAVGDLTVTAEAGMKFTDLRTTLAQANQFLAIDPAYPESATLGGIVATGDTGCLRQRYGSVRDMLIGISIVRTDGKRAKAGGRVVKNVAGYDLMKLFTGSYGTLGAIEQVTFRIYPLPAASQTIVLSGEPEKIAQVTATLLASGLSPVAIELVTPTTLAPLGLGNAANVSAIGLIVRFQSIEVSVEKQADYLLQIGQAMGLNPVGLAEADESCLWQQLREQMDGQSKDPQITCKIGVSPSKATEMLNQFSQFAPTMPTGVIHANSGLGVLRFDVVPTATLLQIRQLCQSQGGFLSILEAPSEIKQTLDVWGYSGNGLDVMRKIKQQFDPEHLFSPQRFVGGI